MGRDAERKERYERLFGAVNIPFCILEEGRIALQFPGLEEELFTKRFTEICLWDLKAQGLKPNTPVVHFLKPGFFLGLYQFSGKAHLIFGPSIPGRYSWTDIAPWLDSALYTDNSRAMGRLLLSLEPVSAAKYINSFCLAVYLYDGCMVRPEDIYMKQPLLFQTETRGSLASYIVESRESFGFHTPQSYENQMSEAIRQGKTGMLKALMHQPVTGRLGVLSFNPERQARYMFATVASVAARSAMRGGMNYEAACSMADIYCQRMDSMTDLNKIEELSVQMLFDFCQEVARKKHSNYSYLVQTCCDYIQKHTHEKIYLRDLAELCNYSERRLSKKFYQETGIRIVDYIHREKMEEARLLLQHSNYAINEIGSFLGYGNQSYFTRKFKEIYGETPFEIRRPQVGSRRKKEREAR